jgi:hypothetical protein
LRTYPGRRGPTIRHLVDRQRSPGDRIAYLVDDDRPMRRVLSVEVVRADPVPWCRLLVRVGVWSMALAAATWLTGCEQVAVLAS